MGLRCSLLGHAYGEPSVERDRDDRGDEVVVTVRELRTCERCGATETVSENTEVRPVRPAPEDAADEESADEEPADPDPDPAPAVDDEFEPPASAAEDDAVILDDEPSPEPAEREPGEWPSAEDTRVEEASPEAAAPEDAPEPEAAAPSEGAWPDRGDAEDEGFDATPDTADGDVEMGGLTPRGVTGDDAEAGEAVVGTNAGGYDTGIASAEADDVGGSDDVDVDAVFVCPNCEYTERVLESSLREGDICPACQRGYLAERASTRN